MRAVRNSDKKMTEVRLRLPHWAVPNLIALLEAAVRDGKRLKNIKVKLMSC